MRFGLTLLLLLLLTVPQQAQADPWSHKGYVTGQVITGGAHYGLLDMGYVHRAKPFQQVAIFRSRNKVYHPVGVYRIERVDATKSTIRQTREAPVKAGDLVVTLERDLVPLDDGGFLEDHFVRTHIINRGSRNGYDTGIGSDIANAFRVQSHEIRNRRSKAWGDGFKRITVELPVIEKDMRRALILQLEHFRNEAKSSPRSFSAMSREWKQVMLLCESRLTLSSMAAGLNDQRITEAAMRFAPELDDEAGQVIAFMISRGITSPANQEAAIKATFRNSQFGTLSTDDRLPKAIATFIQDYAAANAPADAQQQQ